MEKILFTVTCLLCLNGCISNYVASRVVDLTGQVEIPEVNTVSIIDNRSTLPTYMIVANVKQLLGEAMLQPASPQLLKAAINKAITTQITIHIDVLNVYRYYPRTGFYPSGAIILGNGVVIPHGGKRPKTDSVILTFKGTVNAMPFEQEIIVAYKEEGISTGFWSNKGFQRGVLKSFEHLALVIAHKFKRVQPVAER